MINLVITGKVPSKKNRYLMGNGRFYKDQKTTDILNTYAWEIKGQLLKLPQDTKDKIYSSSLGVHLLFRCDNRSDIDNMVSSVFDLLQQAGVIKNDRQIIRITAVKQKCKIPETLIAIEEYDGHN